MKKYLLALLLPLNVYAAEQKAVPAFVFVAQKAACSLVDGKLVLQRMWPLGSWEECAQSILFTAQQIQVEKDAALKELAALKAQPKK